MNRQTIHRFLHFIRKMNWAMTWFVVSAGIVIGAFAYLDLDLSVRTLLYIAVAFIMIAVVIVVSEMHG